MKKSYSILAYFLLAFFCLLSFLWLLKSLFIGYYPDFITQYKVPQLVFEGINPYRKNEALFTPQVYPPTEFIFFYPITFLSLSNASYLYTFFSILCIPLSLYLLAKICRIPLFSKKSLFISALTFISFPVKFTLGMGQINNYVLLLLAASLFFLSRKRMFRGGLFAGIAFSIKLFPVLLPLYFLYAKKIKVLAGFCFWILISIVVTVTVIDKKLLYDFFINILPTFLSSWKTDYYNQALSGFISRSFGVSQFSIILKSIVSIGVIGMSILALKKQKKENILLSFGLIITVNLLVNTFSWQHHFVWLVIPFYIAAAYYKKIKTHLLYFSLLGTAYLLVAGNISNPLLLPAILRDHVFFGTVILFGLLIKLLLRNTEK